ncbi:MAG: TlpA family protein disulfide reductase [Anaerolineae bacterium]
MQSEVSAQPYSAKRLLAQGLALAAVLAFLALLAYGLRLQGLGPLTEGSAAPPFTLDLFEGGQISLDELRGQVVVVNFWASWCPTCRDEAPFLEEVWRQYKDEGVTFIGVDYLDTEPQALAYLKEFDITYPNGPDLGSRISHAYRLRGVPETFFINREGRIATFHKGPISEEKLRTVLETLTR